MRVLARTKTVLGLPRKRVTRPTKKGEKPLVEDVVPFEKLSGTSAITAQLLDSVYAEIDGPALPMSSFQHRRFLPDGLLDVTRRIADPAAELTRLKEDSKTNVARIDRINDALETMIYQKFDSPQHALKWISRLESDFGVKPDDRTKALVADIAIKVAKPNEALALLEQREGVLSGREETLFGELVIRLLKSRESLEEGVQLYERYAQKVVSPAPIVVSHCINALAKQSFVERAFRVYREARENKQMQPNVVCQSALLFAAAKRREYYREAVDIFRQLLALNMPVDTFDYANLMMAAGKVGDMETALQIWQRCCDLGTSRNPHLITNLFYALASTEVKQAKLSSLRKYCSDLSHEDILKAAKEIYEGLQDDLKSVERIRCAYLACLCTHGDMQEASALFFNPTFRLFADASSVENFVRLCDTVRDVDMMEKAVSAATREPQLKMTKLTYRAIIRMYAQHLRFDEALQWLEKMTSAGHVAERESLKMVEIKLWEEERDDLMEKYLKMLDPTSVKRRFEARPPWRERSIRLAANLKTAYGPNAPKLATTY